MAVVDPQRDVDQYFAEAEAGGKMIKYVIETHLHVDFVSGHRGQTARTGAEIGFGAKDGCGATFQFTLPSELKVGESPAASLAKAAGDSS